MRLLIKSTIHIKISVFILTQIFVFTNICQAGLNVYDKRPNNTFLSPPLVLPGDAFQKYTVDSLESAKKIGGFFKSRGLGEFSSDKHVVLELKCDGVYNIEKALEHIRKRFKILFAAKSYFSEALLSRIYDEHKGKSFFPFLKKYMEYSPMLLVLEAKEGISRPAWEELRDVVGIKWGTDKGSFRWEQEVVYFIGKKGRDVISVYKIGRATFDGNGTAGLTVGQQRKVKIPTERKVLIGKIKLKQKLTDDLMLNTTGTHSPDKSDRNIIESALLLDSIGDHAQNLVDEQGNFKQDSGRISTEGINRNP